VEWAWHEAKPTEWPRRSLARSSAWSLTAWAYCGYNKVKRFEVVGIDPPEIDAFAPPPLPSGNGSEAMPSAIAAAGDDDQGDASFDPQKLEAEGGAA
jgi:hypothetical protein